MPVPVGRVPLDQTSSVPIQGRHVCSVVPAVAEMLPPARRSLTHGAIAKGLDTALACAVVGIPLIATRFHSLY